MTLAIKFGDSLDNTNSVAGFVYMDAVTQYTRDFKGQLTSHPIGRGSLISDHFIRSNPVYTFTAVISAADISLGRSLITDYEKNRPSNTTDDIESVRIKNANSLLSLLPESSVSFFVDADSSVVVSTQSRRQTLSDIRNILEKLFDNDQVQLIKLFEYEGIKITRMIDNLVMNSLSFNETAEDGYALYISISLEKAEFTDLSITKLTKKDIKELNADKVADDIKDPAKAKSNLGKADSDGNLLRRTPEQLQKTADDLVKAKNLDASVALRALQRALQ